jgi:hypothetical protein
MASSFFPSPSFLLTTALPPVANMIPTASKRLKTGYTIFAAESASLPRYLEIKIPSTIV